MYIIIITVFLTQDVCPAVSEITKSVFILLTL